MSVSNYSACVAFTRKWEGGNTDVKGDRGGRTGRGGITHITYDAYRHKNHLPLGDVFLISDAEIAAIYRDEYWNPIDGDNLPVGVDLCLFDLAINSGPVRAHKVVYGKGAPPADQVRMICAARLRFLRSLRSWGQFGRGWSRRVKECEAAALHMIAATDPATRRELDQSKARAAVRASNTKTVTGVLVSAGAALLHILGGMPTGLMLAAAAIAAFVVIHGVIVAIAARAKVSSTGAKTASTAVKAPPLSPPVATATAQWPSMQDAPRHRGLLEWSASDIATLANEVVAHINTTKTNTEIKL